MFTPAKNVKVGDNVSSGDVIGNVIENTMVTHKIMLPPGAMGKVTFIASEGNYTLEDDVIEIEFQSEKKGYTMMQTWPVRLPRPSADKLASDTPLLTGQRVLDSLFPYLLFILILYKII